MKKSNEFFLLSILIFINGFLASIDYATPPNREQIKDIFGIPVFIPIAIFAAGLSLLFFILGKKKRKKEMAEVQDDDDVNNGKDDREKDDE